MRLILILFILFFPLTLFGKTDSTKTLKLGLNTYISYVYIAEQNINPGIICNYGKHSAFLGLFLAYNVRDTYEYNLPGIQGGYKIFPDGIKKRFNLFFEYNFIYFKNTVKNDNIYYGFYHNGKEYDGIFTKKLFSFEHYFGHGINIRLIKNLFFNTSIGCGFNWYNYNKIFECDTGEVIKFDDYSEKLHFNWASIILKFGLEYNFLKMRL